MNKADPFPTINDTSKRLGLSTYILRKWVKEEKIPYIKCGNRVRINYAKLIEQLDAESVNGKCR